MKLLRWIYKAADRLRQKARARYWEAAQALGSFGEDVAHRVLQEAGMTVVARNYETNSGAGEIDLVAWEGETLVFVEVKTRSSKEFSLPERAVDEEKRRRILRGAADYVRRIGASFDKTRFDIVGVVVHGSWDGSHKGVEVMHRRAAFHPHQGGDGRSRIAAA